MFRKPETLIPLEEDILAAAIDLSRSGEQTFYGFGIAKAIQEGRDRRLLTGHGTLYRALLRLEKRGFVSSEWEDSEAAASEHRPPRRIYRLTAEGAEIASRVAKPIKVGKLRPSVART